MPRPKGTTKPDAMRGRMQIRCTEEERVAFEARAKAVGYSTPEWARTLLRRDAGMWTGQEDSMDSKSIDRRAADDAQEAFEAAGAQPWDEDGTCIIPVAPSYEQIEAFSASYPGRDAQRLYREGYRQHMQTAIASLKHSRIG